MPDQHNSPVAESIQRVAEMIDESGLSDDERAMECLVSPTDMMRYLNEGAKSGTITPSEYHRQRLNLILAARVRAFSIAEIIRASARGGRGFMYPAELQAAVTDAYLRGHLEMPANARAYAGDFRHLDDFVIGARDGYVAWARAL